MKRKPSKSSGRGVLIIVALLILAVSFVIWLIEKIIPVLVQAGKEVGSAFGSFFVSIYYGALRIVPFILAVLVVYYIYRLIIVVCGHKPLTSSQIEKLAERKTESYIRKNYKFKSLHGDTSIDLKQALNKTEHWMEVCEASTSFPGYVTECLKDKGKCVVLGLEKDGIVDRVWCSEEIGDNGLPNVCSLENLQKVFEKGNYISVICCYHYPKRVPSEEGGHTDTSYYEWADERGYNWIEFSCYEGVYKEDLFLCSDHFSAPNYSVSDIIDRSGVCDSLDYELQKEYWGANFVSQHRPTKKIIITGAVIFGLLCLSVGVEVMAEKQGISDTKSVVENETETESISTTSPPFQTEPEVRKGDIITFGEYMQDVSLDNGLEDIEWIVLESKNNEYLLISKYVLSCAAYNTTGAVYDWRDSSLYEYINGDFYESAFSEEDQGKMLPVWDDSEEVVSLLDVENIETYCTDDLLKAVPTAFAESRNIHVYPSGGCMWWTRSMVDAENVVCVNDRGRLYMETGLDATLDNVGVRPVIRIRAD